MWHSSWLYLSINTTAQHIDFKILYEQQLSITTEQQKLLEFYQIAEQKYQQQNDLQSQQINLLRLQILELQKFILSGKQEKFKLTPNNNEQQTALF